MKSPSAILKLNKSIKGSFCEIELSGWLDSSNAFQLEQLIEESKPEFDALDTLVVCCNDLEFVSSAGLRVFLMLHREASNHPNLSLTFCCTNDNIVSVIDVTGLNKLLSISANKCCGV